MARQLKILHTMTWLAPGGGADANVLLSVRELMRDYEIHLTTGRTIYRNEFEKLEGLPIHICPHLVRPIRPLKDLKALWWYYRFLRREKFDIVHTHETKSSFVVKLAAWLAGVPLIIYGLHGVPFNDPLSRARRLAYIWLERLTIWTSDLVISVSQSCLEEYQNRGMLHKTPTRVAYSGIEVERFLAQSALSASERDRRRKAIGIGTDDLALINLGRFSHAKAQRYTIEAFAMLKKDFPNLKLVLVGEGELKEACRAQAEALEVEDDVIFHGFTQDVAGVIALADVNVLTSLREGLPRVVVEAGLCGVPTAAFEVEGIYEIVTNGDSGFVVPKYNTPTLADRIARLLANDELRATMGSRVREHAKQNWDYRIMVQTIRRCYNNWAQAHRPGVELPLETPDTTIQTAKAHA